MKVKAKEREKSHGFNFFLVEGLFVACRLVLCKLGYFVKKNAIILTCFAKYDFLVDFFVGANEENYQGYSRIYI